MARPREGIDVVIVTADTRELVLACVERLDDRAIARVIVVDNASQDATTEAMRRQHPEVVRVRLEEPVGFATACNRGAERGGAEMILFLNSDVLALEGAVSTLARELDANALAVAAGGRLLDPGTRATQERYQPKRFPTLATFAVQLSGLEQLWPGNPWTRRQTPARDSHATSAVEQPAGACMLVRRSVFDELGGFDESYWFWYEDVDLARRLAERGILLYVPGAAFEHVGGASFAGWDRAQRARSFVQGMLRYAEVHFDRTRQLALAVVVVAVSAPRVLLLALFYPHLARTYATLMAAALRLARGRPVGGSHEQPARHVE
jgi:N-acetylglucosaminyl-diphospho-decaprenol L-rhamnosyltransferase